jgi:hypothetical protein
MNQTIRHRGMRRAGPASAAVIGAAVMVLGAAACSGSNSPRVASVGSPSSGRSAASSGSMTASPLAFSRCMRDHGVPDFPDPGSDGQVPKVSTQQLGVSSTQLMSAQRACQSLLPDTGGSLATSLRQCEEQGACPQAMVQQVMTQLRKFSQCVRSHGIPKWPDPVIDGQGKPEVIIKPWLLGVNPDSNQVNSIMDQCRKAEHPQVPTPIEEYLPPSGQGS